jgi:ABC-type Fe3+-hydroxamate transport system substrate-binding protein
VVSLLPSATEIVSLVGGGELLVGRSHECDYPPGVGRLPVLTSARTSGDDPADLDRQVRESTAVGASLYNLDGDLLAELAPDLIITQDLCSVCSIDLAAVRRVAMGMANPPEVLSLNPETVEGVLDDVLRVGQALGRVEAATRAAVGLRERLFAAGEHVNPFDDGPSVAFLEWTDPLFVGGHWVPQLVERAGGRHVLNPTAPRATAGAAIGPQMAERVAGRSVVVTPEAFRASEPEWIIICPCGVNLRGAVEMAKAIARASWFRETPAARRGRVAVVDGNQMFARPGPRLVDGFEFLVGLLNDRPDVIPADFPWAKLEVG